MEGCYPSKRHKHNRAERCRVKGGARQAIEQGAGDRPTRKYGGGRGSAEAGDLASTLQVVSGDPSWLEDNSLRTQKR